jgi:hypothetical protein
LQQSSDDEGGAIRYDSLTIMTTPIRIVFAALALLFASSCLGDEGAKSNKNQVSQAEAAELLINRNWMDLWPETETEKLNVFRFVPDMGGGVFQDRTLFKGVFELFTFRVEGEEIRFHLHHSKERVSSKFTIERVSGPKPFDLKLTIDGSPRGPNVYFGRSVENVTDLGLHPLQ